MSYTYLEGKLQVKKLISQFSSSGQLTADTDSSIIDNIKRLPAFFNQYQTEVATNAKYIHGVKRISQNPIPNMLTNPLYQFDVQQHLSTDLTDMVAKGAKSYSFKMDNVGTAIIEEQVGGVWQALPIPVIINNTTPKGEYTLYKGFILASSPTNNVRVRFTGSYPFNVRDKALFAYSFPTEIDIPTYEKYIKYTMPDNFYLLNKVDNKGNSMLRQNTIDWEWEGENELGESIIAINYFLVGEIDIHCYLYPDKVPDDVADGFKFQLKPDGFFAMCVGVAYEVLKDDPVNKSVADKLYAVYQSKLANMTNAVTLGSTNVKNSLFTGSDANTGSKLF